MFGFRDKTDDCWRCCTALLSMQLTPEMGFSPARGLTRDEKTVLMGILAYNIAGIRDARTARKVIGRYTAGLSGPEKREAEETIQEVYAQARMTAESIMGNSLNPLADIIGENISMLEFVCRWKSNQALEEMLASALLNFYVSVKQL